jgi:hypothetical protein
LEFLVEKNNLATLAAVTLMVHRLCLGQTRAIMALQAAMALLVASTPTGLKLIRTRLLLLVNVKRMNAKVAAQQVAAKRRLRT